MSELFGAALLPTDRGAITMLLTRLLLDLLFAGVIMRIAYAKLSQHREYLFTFLVVNVVTFSVAFLMSRLTIGLGLALGLFGVFGILRYRTEAIDVRHLTYLFVVIGLALLNALANQEISLAELLIVNVAIIGTVAVLETPAFAGREASRRIRYDRLDLLDPTRVSELVADLRARTNLAVTKCEVGDTDLLRETADVMVYFQIAPPIASSAPPRHDTTGARASAPHPVESANSAASVQVLTKV